MLYLISKKKRKNATDTYQNRSRKYNCSEKKRKKRGHKMMIKRGKTEKRSETKCKSKGRSYSAPKPVWELLLVRQLQIILGEKLFGPQARLRITPIAWFEPATSMTSLALVARSRLPVDHLEYASLINISYRYGEFSNTGLGGRVRKFVQMKV